MSEYIIDVKNVSKNYAPIGYRPKLRHEAVQILKRAVGLSKEASWQGKPFAALKNVSFSVKRGEGLGIIGRNGAGKTTLLRLLSGIMDPTEGTIEVNGRFATMIGLGAGFDMQRTGIENIYLNAAIYGFPPDRVREFLDDIVSFSELGEFLERPVKKYSSGMIARLGFSVAIHIFPEIIFLDEVLSVGDIAFQAKCMDKMMEYKANGCTFLFVSHSPEAVRTLCERSIWLDHGELMMDAPTDEVVEAYSNMLGVLQPPPIPEGV